MHTKGDREQFGQADEDDAGDVGVEKLDPLYVLFGGAVRVEGMPDKVPGHVNVNECLLEVEEGHVYWLVLLPVQQPEGVDRISSPASSNKSTLIGTDEDVFP